MKKIIAIAAMTLALSSCVQFNPPASTLSDKELCSISGTASFYGTKARFDEVVDELQTRQDAGKLTISVKECKDISDMRWNAANSFQRWVSGLDNIGR